MLVTPTVRGDGERHIVGRPDPRTPRAHRHRPRPFAQFEDLARSLVALDVDLGDEPRHRLAAYVGEDPLLVIDLRPFPPGGIEGPMVEAVAGALALGADRLAAALPGRAWSMDDPVVPVTEDGDLRQRVLLCATARRGEDPSTWLLPFDVDGQSLSWHETVLEDGDCEGWVPHALQVGVDAGWEPDIPGAAGQLARCTALGHEVFLAPAGSDLLDQVAGR